MPSLSQKKGSEGERLAEQYLRERGFVVLERNVRAWKFGELDLVCREGATLVFVEVKARRGSRYGAPEEALSPFKLARLSNAVDWYLQARNLMGVPHRLDVVAIDLSGPRPVLRHLRSVGPGI